MDESDGVIESIDVQMRVAASAVAQTAEQVARLRSGASNVRSQRERADSRHMASQAGLIGEAETAELKPPIRRQENVEPVPLKGVPSEAALPLALEPTGDGKRSGPARKLAAVDYPEALPLDNQQRADRDNTGRPPFPQRERDEGHGR
jgi:hypothetical protein